MSNSIRYSFSQFHNDLAQSTQLLQSMHGKIDDRKVKILNLLDTKLCVPDAPVGDGLYQQACRETLRDLSTQITQWKLGLHSSIEKSEFVNRHERSLLVIAFADVKSGKSTFGNFVSGYYLQNTDYHDLYQPIQYEIQDFSDASKEDRQLCQLPLPFPENEVEATSAIQYYTLNQGLTWVDTPGLHSLTTEHGDLAKEYIQFADLVLFFTSSGSPLKKDEQEILSELLHQGKAVMVVITKSDVDQKTVRDGKIITLCSAKSSENQHLQEGYVMDTIRLLSPNTTIENKRVVSTSVKVARQAIQSGNSAEYDSSSLPTFFSQMGEILSEKAVELKMRRPKNEINHCIDSLITGGKDGLSPFSSTISIEKQKLADQLLELDAILGRKDYLIDSVMTRLNRSLPNALSLQMRQLRAENKLQIPDAVQSCVSDCITAMSSYQCIELYQEELKLSKIKIDIPAIQCVDSVGQGYEITITSIQHLELYEREAKGIGEMMWQGANKLIGREIKFTGKRCRMEQIPTGDNLNGFVQNTWEAMKPEVRDYVEQILQKIIEDYILPLQDRYSQLDQQFELLISELESLKF